MQHYTVTTDPMLLDYALMASQSPLTVSPAQGEGIPVTLTLIVSKPKAAKPVQVGKIHIAIPCGAAANELTDAANHPITATISTTGKDKWTIDQVRPGSFTVTPELDQPVTISDQSVTITFELLVNHVVGTADLTISEVASTGSNAPTQRSHTKHVPKFPYQFYVTELACMSPSVARDEQASLLWQGSVEAEYLMLWGDGHSENVSGKPQPWQSPRLTSATTFMLQVTAKINGEPVTHRSTVTVMVENPNLTATDLRIGATWLGYNDAPNDREFMLYNDDGSDRFPGPYGRLYIGNKAATLRITEAGALDFGSGPASDPRFVIENNQVGINTTKPGNTLDVNGGVTVRQQLTAGSVNTDSVNTDNATVKQTLSLKQIRQADANVGVEMMGDMHVTGVFSMWNPPDIYFPDRKKWYHMNISYNDYADFYAFSDARLKEDIRPIEDALSKVMRLHGRRYRWNKTGLHVLSKDAVNSVSAGPGATVEQHEEVRRAERAELLDKLSGDRIGLIAQDVEAVVPEAVSQSEDGHKSIRYPQLVALLVEAIKQQTTQIQALSERVKALESSSGRDTTSDG